MHDLSIKYDDTVLETSRVMLNAQNHTGILSTSLDLSLNFYGKY